jgi:lactoylglutathione lyase
MKCPFTEPLMRKVDCIRLYVPDLEAGLLYYRDRLGHELIWRTENQVGLRMPDSDAEIVLHTDPQEPEIDMLVDSADAAAARVEAAGGSIVVPPFEIQIGRCVVVQDPWGNQLVLLDASKGLLVTDGDGNVIGVEPPRAGHGPAGSGGAGAME